MSEWNESAGEWGEPGRIYAAIATDRMQYWEWGRRPMRVATKCSGCKCYNVRVCVADNTSGDQDIEKSKTISLRQNFACQMDAVQNCHQYGATKYLFRCASISCFQVVTK